MVEKDKRRVLSALCGGIINAEHQIDQARQVINKVTSTFIIYFEKRVLPLLLDYVVYLSLSKSIDANWTKNINNILKIGTYWKPQPFTTLI